MPLASRLKSLGLLRKMLVLTAEKRQINKPVSFLLPTILLKKCNYDLALDWIL